MHSCLPNRYAGRASRTRSVRRRVGAVPQTYSRNQNELSGFDVELILAAYRQANAPADANLHVRLVPLAEIEANDWGLNISRYVAVEAKAEMEVATAVSAYHDALEALQQAQQQLNDELRLAGLSVD